MRLLAASCLVVFASFAFACGSSSNNAGDGGTADGSASEGNAPANAAFTVSGASLLAASENGVLASIDGGDVVFAARTSGTDFLLARLGSSGEVRWAKTMPASAGDLPSHALVVGTHAYLLAGPQAATGLRVYDVDVASGAVLAAKSYDACSFGMRARAVPDGGLVVSCPGDGGAAYLRLDAMLAVQWAKRGRVGGDVALLADGGFAFAGIASSLTPINPGTTGGPQVGTGAALHLVDKSGASRGWYFMGPGPGTHSLAGVRALPDGKILVALGVDSTRADAVVSLTPLALATFNADGSPAKMLKVALNVNDADGRQVPLQFGGGRSMVARDNETWVGFAANSGRLGSDVRTALVARFGLDGTVKDVVNGGVMTAPTTGGAALMFNLVNGDLALVRATPSDSACVVRPTATVSEVKPFLDAKSAADSKLEDLTVNASDATKTTTDATLTSAAGQCAKK